MTSPKQRLAKERTDWAEDRTDWAEDRTMLASERTFASWIRTALASAAIAIYLNSSLRQIDPSWVGKAIASLFLMLALFMIWAARNRACRTRERLGQRDVRALRTDRITAISALMAVGTLCLGVILWLF